jgi:hypothetical protein
MQNVYILQIEKEILLHRSAAICGPGEKHFPVMRTNTGTTVT